MDLVTAVSFWVTSSIRVTSSSEIWRISFSEFVVNALAVSGNVLDSTTGAAVATVVVGGLAVRAVAVVVGVVDAAVVAAVDGGVVVLTVDGEVALTVDGDGVVVVASVVVDVIVDAVVDAEVAGVVEVRVAGVSGSVVVFGVVEAFVSFAIVGTDSVRSSSGSTKTGVLSSLVRAFVNSKRPKVNVEHWRINHCVFIPFPLPSRQRQSGTNMLFNFLNLT